MSVLTIVLAVLAIAAVFTFILDKSNMLPD